MIDYPDLALPLGLMAAGVAAFWLLTADGQDMAMPDPALTPGAVADSDPDVVCSTGYAEAHRIWPYPSGKKAVLSEYGLPSTEARHYEDDDLVPVSLGGDNGDIRNHWPQACDRWRGSRCVAGPAADKDAIEYRLWRAVCIDHTVQLQDAQTYFLGWGRR